VNCGASVGGVGGGSRIGGFIEPGPARRRAPTGLSRKRSIARIKAARRRQSQMGVSKIATTTQGVRTEDLGVVSSAREAVNQGDGSKKGLEARCLWGAVEQVIVEALA